MKVRARNTVRHADIGGGIRLLRAGESREIPDQEAERLIASGDVIAEKPTARKVSVKQQPDIKTSINLIDMLKEPLRVGLFCNTSRHYSGGRVHLYQYGYALAANGADVWLITNRYPIWAGDYPDLARFKICVNKPPSVPFDLVITQGKAGLTEGLAYRAKYCPSAKVGAWNFETPNWVAKHDPDYATRLHTGPWHDPEAKLIDLTISNSALSRKYLLEYAQPAVFNECLHPAVNDLCEPDKAAKSVRKGVPYVVQCGRRVPYKGLDMVIEAVKSLDDPLDVVAIGGGSIVSTDEKHRIIGVRGISDAEKFAWMRDSICGVAMSKFEGYGMVPDELLSVGTPCIAYPLPVLRERFGDDLIYAEDVSMLRDRLAHLLFDGKQAKPVNGEKVKVLCGMGAMQRRVERLPYHSQGRSRVSAQMICYWSAGCVTHSLRSVYADVDEIAIAYGPCPETRNVPPDGSLELIEKFIQEEDTDGKVRWLARHDWRDKREMREWCMSRLSGNYMLVLDADEVWHNLRGYIRNRVLFAAPKWVNFWHDQDHWIYGALGSHSRDGSNGRWGIPLDKGGSACHMWRWSKWKPSFGISAHSTPSDSNGNAMRWTLKDAESAYEASPTTCVYHLGHMLPREIMQAKHEFYIKRDGDDPGRRLREAAWHNWQGEIGAWEQGVVGKVDWDIPEHVKAACETVKNWKSK